MRLDKFICKSTEFRGTETIGLVERGLVSVNGEIARCPTMQVHENNRIYLEGKLLTPRPSRYIMVHKTLGTICSNVDETYPSLLHLVDVKNAFDLHVVGRLDVDTTGLVLLTDDGRWSFNIIRPGMGCEKVYRVALRDPVSESVMSEMRSKFECGIQLQGERSPTLPAKLEFLGSQEVLLTITQGKYHQVKRMFAAAGNRVVALHRERIGVIQLDIEEGQWRYLRQDEIAGFR